MKFKALLLALLTVFVPATFAMEQITPETDTSSITNHELTIIDSEGEEFKLSPNQSKALLKCESLSAYTDFEKGKIDFSGSNYTGKTFVTKKLILALARFINEPHKALFLPLIEWDVDGIPFDLELFELADFLAAPEKVLFVLANEMWPLMQDEAILSKSQNDYKKHLRKLAEPYVSCPDYLLTYLKSNEIEIAKTKIINSNSHGTQTNIDLSHKACKKITPAINLANNAYLKKYRFITLRGLDKLIEFLRKDNNVDFQQIDLSNHNLETFSTKQLVHLARSRPLGICLNYNKINQLSSKELDITSQSDLPYWINLRSNPIQSIDDSFFEAIRNLRSQPTLLWGGDCMHNFTLKNTALTPEKQKEYAKKFYYATHTLPERIASKNLYENIGIWGCGAIGGILAARMASSYFEDKTIVLALASGFFGVMGGGIGGHNAMGYVLSKLAQRSHPRVANFDMAMIEGGHRYKLELDID
ncbi:hypothetical protein BH09DEP1_BH09DEP1_4790 [soil metagenome]